MSPTPQTEQRHLWWKFKRRSISKELTISLMLLMLVFEGLLLAFVYNIQHRSYNRELQALADSYSDNLAQVLAVPVWDYDDEQIATIGDGSIRNPVVAKVRITDAGGKILFEAGKDPTGADRIARHKLIVHKGQNLGQVDLYVTSEKYVAELVWLRDVIIMVLCASLVAILVTTGILLRIFMRRPLAILKNGIDRVSHGDYDHRFEAVHHSELTDIADRFREMAAMVRDRENSLQREVVERRYAEDKIRQSEANSRALLNAIPDLMFRFDRRGTFLEFEGDRALLLVQPEGFLGKTIGDIFPPRLSPIMMQRLQTALDSGRIQVFEYDLRMREQRRHYESRLVAVSKEQAVAIVRDITEQKMAAAERERLEEKLRRAQKMEAIGTLAGGVAHDLNNVLSGLVSYPELLLLDLPEGSPLRKPVHTIQKSGEKAASIVQDLLTLARRGVSVAEVVNLNQLIRELMESPEFEKLKDHYPDFGCKLDLDPQLLNTTGSPVHLSKTIMNLLSNGVEAVAGMGTVTIQTLNRYVDMPVRGYDEVEPGDYVVMSVADDGIGISPEDINRIFEPFYTKKVMGRSGTGLGMAVVWGTVKDHHGYIDVESKVDCGTRITIYLPATRRPTASALSVPSIDTYRGCGETILLVDDMPEQLEIASRMLTKLGYRVVTASGGKEAVEYLKAHRVDLVILDMIMPPGLDGLDTYRRILAVNPGQKAVIASGYSETDRVREAQALGAGEYIKKPYMLEKIGSVVRKELDR